MVYIFSYILKINYQILNNYENKISEKCKAIFLGG